jgi:hypothetical protein
VRDVIAQGYVHKKGSGYDWCGSRAWKARWAVLVVSFHSFVVGGSLVIAKNKLLTHFSQMLVFTV